MPALSIFRTNCKLSGRRTWPGPVPKRTTGILAVFSQGIKTQIDSRQPVQFVIEIPRHPLQGVEYRFLRRHPVPHVFDDGVRTANPQVFFSAPGGAGASDILV